jgi:TRAP-type mannitol/chloroaromatic compound transport system permease small subunit
MSSADQQLRQLAGLERLQVLRNWALGLGGFSFLAIITIAGFGSTENPKSWSSVYSAMAQGGLLQWAVVPLIVVGLAMLVVGISLHIVIAKGER